MKKYLCIICLLLAGCSTTNKRASCKFNTTFYPNLHPMISINNSVDAIVGYHMSLTYELPVIPQYIVTPIPQTQIQYQQYKTINNKLGKYYE